MLTHFNACSKPGSKFGLILLTYSDELRSRFRTWFWVWAHSTAVLTEPLQVAHVLC